MMKSKKPWLPFVIVFIVLNGFFLAGRSFLQKKGIDTDVLLAGNLVLLAATLLSFVVSWRSLKSANAGASVRALYGSFMIKFFICLAAAFIYIMVAGKQVNKPGLMICMALYLVYTFIEVSALQKLLKQKKNV
jgi:hypothetical protein